MKLLHYATLALSIMVAGLNSATLASGVSQGPNRDANGKIVPVPKGEQCVEETAFMRKNHMDLLLHKRDKTMHEGIRTKQHSLVECINCHATPNESGNISRITDEKHFCASCHISAAVKLDCFECHADRPVSSFKNTQTNDLLEILNSRLASEHSILQRDLGN